MQKMASSVEALGEQLGSLFTQLEQGQQQLSSHQQETQTSLHQETQQIVSGFEEQVKTLLGALNNQQEATENTLRKLAEQTTTHLQDMNTGADKMRVAAERFEIAGDKVKEANHLTAEVLDKAQGAGNELDWQAVNSVQWLPTIEITVMQWRNLSPCWKALWRTLRLNWQHALSS